MNKSMDFVKGLKYTSNNELQFLFSIESFLIIALKYLSSVYQTGYHSVIGLERACPCVGGSVIFPFSISIGFAFEFLLSNVFIGVSLGLFLLKSNST